MSEITELFSLSNNGIKLSLSPNATADTCFRCDKNLSLYCCHRLDYALGAPQECQKRSSFPFVTTMLPNKNFDLPPGVWTDDTSMMLYLAHSISTYR